MEEHAHKVRVECEQCGVQALHLSALTLRCCEDGDTAVRFACARCGLVHLEPVTAAQACQLATCDDVNIEAWSLPVEHVLSDCDAPLTPVEIDSWVRLLDFEHVVAGAIDALELEVR